MKVLHVPFSWFPDPPAGTELYVLALAREQLETGTTPVIAAPAAGSSSYTHDGIAVHRFAMSQQLTLEELWGHGDPVAAQHFDVLLDTVRPDVLHLHAHTAAISHRLSESAERRGIPVVFTYHTPSSTCPRGTLLRWGSEICDGLILDHRCGAYVISAHGIPRVAAVPLEPFARAAAKLAGNKSGGVFTALRLPELVSLYHQRTTRFLSLPRRIIALAEWSRAVLEINGVPAERITTIPHGLLRAVESTAPPRQQLPVQLAFFGRLDRTKGAHLLLQALSAAPHLAVELTLYAIVQNATEDAYSAGVRSAAARDRRVSIRAAIPHAEMAKALAAAHAVVVPSLVLETGPLVVLEAFAARRPVIGSNFGGIAEKVRHDVDGLLVDAHPDAWAAALKRLVEDRDLLTRLSGGIRQPRQMPAVAADVQAVYAAVTA